MKPWHKNDVWKSVGRYGENIQKTANVVSSREIDSYIDSYRVNQTRRDGKPSIFKAEEKCSSKHRDAIESF